MRRIALPAFLALAAALASAEKADAASVAKAARKCRGAIASATTMLAQTAMKSIDACHGRRDAGKFQGDCNTLDGNLAFSRMQVRTTGMIGAACPPGNSVHGNYPDGDIAETLFPEIADELTENAKAVQGMPDILPAQVGRGRAKCHKAIGRARTAIVGEILRRSLACQKRIDRHASTFGALDPSCHTATSQAAGRAAGAIGKACPGIAGPDVGSCSPLPQCVVDAAIATGQTLAADAYGAFVCGDGIREGFEQCDDGNSDPADGCTNTCTLPRCGDGIVQAGEQCDDGNRFDSDTCRNDCTNPVCGDGIVAAGVEECDDGNLVPGDGCTNCKIDTAYCGSDGVQVTVELVYDPGSVPDVAGVRVDLGYPQDVLDLPGTGAEVAGRVTDLANRGIFTVNDHDTSRDPDSIDDTLTVGYVSSSQLPPGDLVRVRFDCPAGTPLVPRDFDCVIGDASDSQGNTIGQGISCTVSVAGSGTGSTTTSTSTSTSATAHLPTTTSATVGGTTTTTLPHACGNGTIEPGETCDDGNTVDESDASVPANPPDYCPRTCRIETCRPGTTTAQDVSVDFSAPAGAQVGGLTVFLDYPDAKTSIPGSGSSVSSTIKNLPAGALSSPNDLDYGLIEGVVSLSAIAPGRLFTVTFHDCPGAPALTAGDFRCVVKDASDTQGNAVGGVTCTVSIP